MTAERSAQKTKQARQAEPVLLKSLLSFFEYEHFPVIRNNTSEVTQKEDSDSKQIQVDGYTPDVIAEDRQGYPVYGMAVGCQDFLGNDNNVINQLQSLARRGIVYVVAPEACGESVRSMKETVLAGEDIRLLFV